MTLSILIGVPSGWHLSADWQANFMAKIGEQRTAELALRWARSNTKAFAYSDIIDQGVDFDYTWIWETNVVLERPLQYYIERVQNFECVFSPGRFDTNDIGAWPVGVPQDQQTEILEADGEGEDRELAPFPCYTGATHFVSMTQRVVRALVKDGVRFMWARKDLNPHLDKDHPIYCYDGDQDPYHWDPWVTDPDQGNPHRRLAIEQSFYSNIRKQYWKKPENGSKGIHFNVWADPRLYTTNLRLGGAFPSLRMSNRFPEVPKIVEAAPAR